MSLPTLPRARAFARALLPLLLSVLPAVPAAALPSFVAGTPVALPEGANGVAAGDVTGDGIPDLVCTTYSLLLVPGLGGALYGTPAAIGSVISPTSVAVAPLDGDAIADVAVTSLVGRNVQVFRSLGGGSFALPLPLAAGLDPRYLWAGDILGFGARSLVVSDGPTNTITVFHGNGDGTFQPAYVWGVGIGPNSFGVADFTQDGYVDLAVANYGSQSISIGRTNEAYPSYFTGRYDRPTDAASPLSGAAGDLDANGAVDFVVTTAAGVRVFRNYGGGNLWIEPGTWTVGTNPRAAHVADFDGDGHLDVVVANLGSGTVSVLPGNGDLTFGTAIDYPVGASPFALDVHDLDGDGDLDIVVASNGGNALAILLNAKVTAAVSPGALPAATALLAARPNPGRGGAEIPFVLDRAGAVTLRIYDLQGRNVRTLAAGRTFEAGPARLPWDGRDDAGAPLPAGTYLVRMIAGTGQFSSKVQLVR